MNARNFLYIQRYNNKASKKFADDKLYTKTFLQSRDIQVAKTYHTIKNYNEIENISFKSLPESFVVKPNHGYGGEGILVVQKKNKASFQLVSGEKLTWEELYLHLAAILDGKYALSGSRDQAIIEERLEAHDFFKHLMQMKGIPDIRIIVFNYVPVLAMLRVPTKKSSGKGNLQLGAIGLGIDIATGKLSYGYQNGKFFHRLKSGEKISSFQIPHWDEMLLATSKIQQSTNIGYLGVDLVLSKTGIKTLEVNARPGLKIQICTGVPLKDRLDLVEGYKVLNPEQGVKLAKSLFSQKVISESPKESSKSGKIVIGLKEPIIIFCDKVQSCYAKIDPHAEENLISSSIDVPEGLLDVSIQNKRLKLPFKHSRFNEEYDAIIAGKYLGDFVIDMTVKNKINSNQIEDIQEKMIANVDKKLAEIDENIALMSYFNPQNLVEVQETFLKYKNFNPQFVYKMCDENSLDEMRKDLLKIPRHIDHILMPLYEEKIQELEGKIQLIQSRDTKNLAQVSESIFGKVDYDLYKSAVLSIKNNKGHKDESKKLSASEVLKRLKGFLEEKHLDHWKIDLTEGSAANMSVSKKGILFVSKNISITENHLKALIAHEVETHIYRMENARLQKYKVFQRGTAKYLETEEGLAVYNQNRIGVHLGEKEIWAALRVVGAYMGKKMSFIELFLYLQDTFQLPDESAWKTCIKVKRGLLNTGTLTSFTKDTIYFTGLKKIQEFMKSASPEDIAFLYSGKISLDSLEVLRNVEIIKPKFIPEILL
jgi:alpha-L-glutamate ligase-like protein